MTVQQQRAETFICLVKGLFPNKKPFRWVEIGVYDGSHARMVLSALKVWGCSTCYAGYDLFEEALRVDLSHDNPGIHSQMRQKPRVMQKRVRKIRVQEMLEPLCEEVVLVQGNSGVTLTTSPHLPRANLVYIDGGHSYECVSADWAAVVALAPKSCVVMFDDVGWEGVNRVIQEAESTGRVFERLDEWRRYTVM